MSKKEKRSNKRIKSSVSGDEGITINNMMRKQFEAVPHREKWDEHITCDCIVIMPTRKMHDSGYRAMDFVAIKDGKPLMRLSGCSDVIHIDGIGGGGYKRQYSDLVKRKSWSIDCLKKSGLLRMWVNQCNLICGGSLSSFELWAVEMTQEEKKQDKM
jgi:hypothetical protein